MAAAANRESRLRYLSIKVEQIVAKRKKRPIAGGSERLLRLGSSRERFNRLKNPYFSLNRLIY
ncbi:hypothetical protein USDA257_c59070 [Sinorhizobium fredii USDA 257]|uniref:Uncharacterized protein n=1 Tax=Sinorhizobium fredii (strain USDA 257) TaxID=1185652 RepID=I3XEW2_SINF2|nr:hypothetical protein USDA257_c59070 [Sinorhizobium fredii USDA 257]